MLFTLTTKVLSTADAYQQIQFFKPRVFKKLLRSLLRSSLKKTGIENVFSNLKKFCLIKNLTTIMQLNNDKKLQFFSKQSLIKQFYQNNTGIQ